jgi:uncharacterized protein (TIGR02246 family)
MTGFIAGSRPASALLALVACAVLVAGCGGSPTEHVEADSSQPQLAVVTPPMEAGIVALLDRWTDAWSAMDAQAFAAVYTQDADFVNPLGAVVSGRAAIQAAHTFLFGSLFAGSRQTWEIRRLVPVTGNFVLVDLNVALSDFQATPPGLLVSPDGVVRTRTRLTVARGSEGAWEIQSQQLTAYVP